MRLFRLNRQVDVSGVSGTGIVAHAVEFADGTTIVKFETGHSTYPTLADAIRIHGHSGDTIFEMVGEYTGTSFKYEVVSTNAE